MDEIIKYITLHNEAPPFIGQDDKGNYVLQGRSDLATGEVFEYECGKMKLTANNHTNTLLSLMKFIATADELDDHELLDLSDKEVVKFMERLFEKVLRAYFGEPQTFHKVTALKILTDNPQIVNEAIYNLVSDSKETKRDYDSIVNGLDGEQFNDPYISMAYELANHYKKRPYELIAEWSTSELVVAYAKISNDASLSNYRSWSSSQKEYKPKQPKKQVFFFKEVEGEVEDDNNQT
ncbi:hypothetical protein BG262_02860 [Floricoccus penangensis]|uniref:Uncharacterized protein n=1 Tax=Floricoccus penangensis TaxID=1859475 RepID=A0A9Q5JGA3_9LACT|nr:hypothetical protein [Floricoccus penangensis]OFI46755.1 hypothetical protein BG262_02860 [Floricoccus penangensis]